MTGKAKKKAVPARKSPSGEPKGRKLIGNALQLSSREEEHKAKEDRVETGIFGLDELLEGGLPRNGLYMISGKCGTGKTTFGLQYLNHGAANKSENGVFVALEKGPDAIIASTKKFGWKFDELIRNDRLSVVKPDMHRFESFKKTLEDEIYRVRAKRLVIDSFSLISAYFHNDVYDVRRSIVELAEMGSRLGCTTLILADILEGSPLLSYKGYKEFVVSGVIVLDIVKKDPSTFARTLLVRKLADTNHSLKLVPIEISPEGIMAYPDAEVF